QPALTQILGPWLRERDGKISTRLSQHKTWMSSLIEQLPKFSYFRQNWHWRYTNWLPFYWAGFSQCTSYTYVLHELKDKDKLWSEIQGSVRTDIKKSINRFGLAVRNDLSVNDFLIINRKTFDRQGMRVPYSDDY